MKTNSRKSCNGLFETKADEPERRECGKLSFFSKSAARKTLKKMIGHKGYTGEIYKCQRTGAWHLGRSSRRSG